MRRFMTTLLLTCLWSPPLLAETRLLAIGIDEYDHGEQLYGAAADALDIRDSLSRFGAQDVTLLRNREADRAAIEAAWRAMVARAAPGDLLVLTYSGHGGYEPDRNGDEALLDPEDVYDEHFALSGFTPENPRERILDDELDLWFREALEKGLRVLFLADSCHSGSMYRGGGRGRSSSRASALSDETLWRNFTPPVALAPPRPPPPEAEGNFFFVSAVDQRGIVREMTINGVKRGALSHLFARAIDSAADVDHNGVIDHLELGGYLEAAMPSFDNEVRREFHPRPEGPPVPILIRPGGSPPGAPPLGFPDLRLALRCETPTPEARLFGLRVVDEAEAPDLIYECRTSRVLDESGGLIAEEVRLHAADLSPILEKFRLVRFVQNMAARAPVSLEISPEKPSRRIGEQFDLSLNAGRPWTIIFNLANKGEVQPVFPQSRSEALPREAGRPLVLRGFDVRPPAGADHLIVVASGEEPKALRAALDEKAGPPRLLEILRDMAQAGGVSAAAAHLYAEE